MSEFFKLQKAAENAAREFGEGVMQGITEGVSGEPTVFSTSDMERIFAAFRAMADTPSSDDALIVKMAGVIGIRREGSSLKINWEGCAIGLEIEGGQ